MEMKYLLYAFFAGAFVAGVLDALWRFFWKAARWGFGWRPSNHDPELIKQAVEAITFLHVRAPEGATEEDRAAMKADVTELLTFAIEYYLERLAIKNS